MNATNQALLAAVVFAVLAAAILLVSFPPPKPHPGNHRGTPLAPDTTTVLPRVLTLDEYWTLRAGQPQAWLRAVGRVTVPDRCRSYLPARHAAIEAVSVR
jgi:hypothetical protein